MKLQQIVTSVLAISGIALLGCMAPQANAGTFNIASGDVTGLKNALTIANTNNETDIINLAANGSYVLTAVDNIDDGANGLPVIENDSVISDLTINGNGATIRRSTANGAPNFRILRIRNATVEIFRLNLTGGNADTTVGGAIFNTDGSLNTQNCTFSNNNAGFGGGGIHCGNGTLNVQSCTFFNNNANTGGGIYNSTGTVTVTNSTFVGNVADGTQSDDPNSGGAIFNDANGGTIALDSCTIVGNTAARTGGGVAASATVRNCIIADNTAPIDPDAVGFFDSQGYNLVGQTNTPSGSVGFDEPTDQTGSAAAPLDPQLDPAGLKDNGGPTHTIALLPNSPARDKGNTALATDQRGKVRPFDDPTIPNATGGDGSDIGAFEVSPTLNIGDTPVKEGNSGTTNAIFTVNLDTASSQTVTVNYAVIASTATAGSDYTTQSGTLSFAAGQTVKTIIVEVKGDLLDEADEVFRVNLSAPTNAVIGNAQGNGTIIDDDVVPSLTITDVTVIEGNAGTTNASFTISLSVPSGKTVTVNVIPANGTARAPGDFTTGGDSLVFAPGQTSKVFSVPVLADTLDEDAETIFVLLSSAVNAGIARGRGIATINDDDAAPSITIEDVNIGEGDGAQRTAVFRLHLSAPSGKLVRVNYATGVGTATAGTDYVAVASTQIAFTTGQTVTLARVLINGDTLNEPNETFRVNLSGTLNATLADNQAIGTILNDDSAPALTINDVSLVEGNSGTKNLTFTVSLSAASGQTVIVNYATANGTATADSDYIAKTGTLSFAPGQTSKTINVIINSDTTVEGDETMFVFLSGAVNASIGRGRGIGIIQNDDFTG